MGNALSKTRIFGLVQTKAAVVSTKKNRGEVRSVALACSSLYCKRLHAGDSLWR